VQQGARGRADAAGRIFESYKPSPNGRRPKKLPAGDAAAITAPTGRFRLPRARATGTGRGRARQRIIMAQFHGVAVEAFADEQIVHSEYA